MFLCKLIPADADPRFLAWVHGSGTVNKSDDKNCFDLDPAQYTSALKELKGTSPTASTLPLHCVIPDSPRYKNKKPIPRVSTMVSFEGYLCSRVTNSETGKTERFRIDIDHVNFMGRPTVPQPTPETGPYSSRFSQCTVSHRAIDSASTPNSKRKFKFSFDDVDPNGRVSGPAKRGKTTADKK